MGVIDLHLQLRQTCNRHLQAFIQIDDGTLVHWPASHAASSHKHRSLERGMSGHAGNHPATNYLGVALAAGALSRLNKHDENNI